MDFNKIEKFRKIIFKSKKNNTYKFALAKFLLDYSKKCEEIENKKIDYKVIAKDFLDYYWCQVCDYKIRQVSINNNKPLVVTIIEDYCDKNEIDKNEIIREIEKSCFKDVIPRFQYTNGTFYEHYHEWQESNYKMPHEDKRYIYLFKESIEFFKDNYELLNAELIEEWNRFLERVNGKSITYLANHIRLDEDLKFLYRKEANE